MFPITAIIRLFQGIFYLQSKNIIHRDLKPENILVDRDNNCYINDFETFSEVIDNEENMFSMTNDIGSYYYQSPEQFKGKTVSFPTDIYSFGKIIYFLYENKDDVRQNDIEQEINHCSSNIKSLYKNCVVYDQEKRVKIPDIINFLCIETSLKSFIEQFFVLHNFRNMQTYELIQYFLENILFRIQSDKEENIEIYLNDIFVILSLKLIFQSQFLLFEYYKNDKFINTKLITNEYYYLSKKLCISNAFLILFGLYLVNFKSKQNCRTINNFINISKMQNDFNALNELKFFYDISSGIKIDIQKSDEYLKLSKELNNSFALYLMGYRYEKSIRVSQDYDKAIKYYELSAKQNNSHAQFSLGVLYDFGNGVKQNYIKAKEYYELSAKQNNPKALINLGYLYHHGNGIRQDYKKAKEYYELAAKQNYSCALCNLGDLYYSGEGTKQDFIKAKEYYELSAEQNNSNAFYGLGNLYFEGKGVTKNYKMAKKYYKLSAKQKNHNAFLKLGDIYYYGLNVLVNYKKAIMYYELSAKQNNPIAIFNIGICYILGKGVSVNYKTAKKYLKQSNKHNYSKASLYLGYLYEMGYGCNKNFKKALFYYEMSAKQNNASALIELGNIYFKGRNVIRNIDKAIYYYKNAAYLNEIEAINWLGNIYIKGKYVEKNINRGLQYYEYSANQNDPDTLLLLGNLFSTNTIVNCDINKAIYYFNMLIELQKKDDELSRKICYEGQYYIACNNLGLIYIIYENFKKFNYGIELIKIAGFNEYPFGQNCLGLIYQLYTKEMDNAKYMFMKSAKHDFPLAEYNLGYLSENEGNIDQAISHYIRAIVYEYDPLNYRNKSYKDKMLRINIHFIKFFTHLKLVEIYLKMHKIEGKQNFIGIYICLFDDFFGIFTSLNKMEMRLKFISKFYFLSGVMSKIVKSKLQSFHATKENIVNKFQDKLKWKEENKKEWCEINQKKLNQNDNNIYIEKKPSRNDIIGLYEYALSNSKFNEILINNIHEMIEEIENILYTPPYTILFGRMIIHSNTEQNMLQKNISEAFYEGFYS